MFKPLSSEYQLRLATLADVPTLEALITASVHGLQTSYYTETERQAALGPIFGVDRQLILDGTYFVIEHAGEPVACGGWSWRATTYGGDTHHAEPGCRLNPAAESARIRAFFVHPAPCTPRPWHRSAARQRGRRLCRRLSPRHHGGHLSW